MHFYFVMHTVRSIQFSVISIHIPPPLRVEHEFSSICTRMYLLLLFSQQREIDSQVYTGG